MGANTGERNTAEINTLPALVSGEEAKGILLTGGHWLPPCCSLAGRGSEPGWPSARTHFLRWEPMSAMGCCFDFSCRLNIAASTGLFMFKSFHPLR